jgi:hypothetical protein
LGDFPPTTKKQFASAAAAMSSTNFWSLKTSEANSLTSSQVRAQDVKRFAARRNEPSAKQA